MSTELSTKEIWLDISGYEGYYQVSNLGNVKSVERKVPHERKGFEFIKERILKQHINRYAFVLLSKNRKTTNKTVHRLVAFAFIPNPENKPQVNHINGIKDDNRVENLEWCTIDYNNNHALVNNLKPKGENHGSAKLSEKEVLEIRNINNSLPIRDIAKKYNVQKCTIEKILKRKTWKHI